jgi:tetratricopeptide (TPR) repeat protein
MNPLKKNVLFTALIVLMLLWLPLTCLANRLNHPEWVETIDRKEAVQQFDQGREAFEMGRTGDAIIYFDKAVQNDAEFAIAWLYKALTAQTDAERKTSIDKAVLFRNNASEEERILIDIELTYADDNSEKRFLLAKQLVRLNPENARALLVLAGEYQQRGDIGKFRHLAHEAIRVEPLSPLGYRALAASWLMNESLDFEMAEAYMKKFVELRSMEASAHIAMGDVYRACLDLLEAKTAFSKAIEIEPNSVVALSKRGYVNTYLGLFDEARADFKRASALSGHTRDYAQPNANIFSFLFSGNGKVATPEVVMTSNNQHKNKKLPMSGESDNCYFCCTFISMSHGLVVSPDVSLNTCNYLSYIFDKESRVPDETAVEANIAFIKGIRAVQQQDYEKARHIIDEYAHIVDPVMKPQKNEAHNFLLGLSFYGQGQYSKALAQFQKSDTGNIFVKYNIGLAYTKLGMHQEAAELLKEVADLNFANFRNSRMETMANFWLKSYADASNAVR